MQDIGRAEPGRVFRAAALPLPLGASQRRINWRYALAVGSYHLLALLALLPWFFSRTGAWLAVSGVYVFGAAGINLCYHRLLSYRSFSCPLWLEHCFAIIAVCCVEDTPARWVATHRLHHHRADERPDPHSPLVNMFWSYTGWLFIENADLARGLRMTVMRVTSFATNSIAGSSARWFGSRSPSRCSISRLVF